MLSWYRTQLRDHGAAASTRLLFRIVWSRVITSASNKFLPATLSCPCCGWTGSKFLDYIEAGYTVPDAACPQCDSHPRHRRLFLWLNNDFRPERKVGTALVFAPEKALATIWKMATGLRVIRVDIEPSRGVDVLADVQKLPFADNSADIIWCHHVLEQVPDDQAAMSELYRVLRSKVGELVISAGIAAGRGTVEFEGADKSLSGNRRSYGDDFPERLEQGGFQVRTVEANLSTVDCKKYGIRADELFFVCVKDNPSNSPALPSPETSAP